MSTIYLPTVSAGQPQKQFMRDWDPRLIARGAVIYPAAPNTSETVWRVIRGLWYDESEAGGRHHIYVDTIDETGRRAVGVPVRFFWQDNGHTARTEAKPDEMAAVNFPMYAVAPSYGVSIIDGQSDVITGLGLGSIEQPNYTIHTAYLFVFQRTQLQSARARQGVCTQ